MIDIKEKIKYLPTNPGCYLMRDKNNQVIYVGKAKNLKNRVKSYFSGSHNMKTTKMVSLIVTFDYIITSNETEALILEMNLIKEHDPKYNILLTDDKTYPYILLSNNQHPTLEVTRKIRKGVGKYYGPYPNVSSAREVVKLLNSIYPLRKCKNIPRKECIYFSMNQCLAPCIKNIKKDDYSKILYDINSFLNGNTKEVVDNLKLNMENYSKRLMYEKAGQVKKLIQHITNIENKQKVTIGDYLERDVYGFYFNNNQMSVEIFFVRQGKVVANDRKILNVIGESQNTIDEFIFKYYQKNPLPKEILSTQVTTEMSNILDVKVIKPKIGDKKKLVDLAIINAKEQLEKNVEILNIQSNRTLQANEELGRLLNINDLSRIESFDNSNISGTSIVSGMTVFIDGEPSRKDYRKYKIITVDNQDDYGSMKEVMYRRYRRVIMDNLIKPDLIVVDGGKGQINVAKDVLNSLSLKIPICGLKKNDKHSTESLITEDLNEININKRSNVFHLLTRIQDETHRYAISFHRQVRSKSVVGSILDNIEGVGEGTRNKLLYIYKDIYDIKEKGLNDLINNGISEKLAINIIEYLNDEVY